MRPPDQAWSNPAILGMVSVGGSMYGYVWLSLASPSTCLDLSYIKPSDAVCSGPGASKGYLEPVVEQLQCCAPWAVRS